MPYNDLSGMTLDGGGVISQALDLEDALAQVGRYDMHAMVWLETICAAASGHSTWMYAMCLLLVYHSFEWSSMSSHQQPAHIISPVLSVLHI